MPHVTPDSIPTLDLLAQNPSAAIGLPKEILLSLALRCSTAQSVISSQLAAVIEIDAQQQNGAAADRLLDVKGAAEKLNVSTDWLYRSARKLPFAVHLGSGQLRFSSNGIGRYIQTRQRQNNKA